MADNDYNVLVNKILKYLYDSLKTGNPVDLDAISAEKLGGNEYYRGYILAGMLESGYVQGYQGIKIGDTFVFAGLPNIEITPAGIERLTLYHQFPFLA